MTIGDRIRIKREEMNMTQDELAAKLGYKSRSTINKIERGVNDLVQSKIVEFAKVLNTTPSYLMGWEIEKTETGYTVNDGEEEIRIELIDATKDMSIEQIRELINFAKFMKSEVSKNGKEG